MEGSGDVSESGSTSGSEFDAEEEKLILKELEALDLPEAEAVETWVALENLKKQDKLKKKARTWKKGRDLKEQMKKDRRFHDSAERTRRNLKGSAGAYLLTS